MTSTTPDQRATARRLIILGSTGSIGTATLDAVRHLRNTGIVFDIVGLAAGRNASELAEQAAALDGAGCQPLHLAVADADADDVAALQRATSSQQRACIVHTGPDASRDLINAAATSGDLVVAAIVGAAGLPATLAAIERGCDVALANKETLVAAGEIVMPRVRASGVHLLPVDSEHSAIFQCLQCDDADEAGRPGRTTRDVKRIVITASGGPFRTWSRDQMAAATVDEALAHPTWSMGAKVTIDSATMMNKALEIIEAHWLFGLDPEQIDVIVHPQSIVHGFVEFADGSIVAQLSPPDMRMPIQYALTWPGRVGGCARQLDWRDLSRLDFDAPDTERFPAIALAYDAIRRGGSAGAVLNAANEVAVDAFIGGRIGFLEITRIVADVLNDVAIKPIQTIRDVLAADGAARHAAQLRIDATVDSAPGDMSNRASQCRQALP